MALFDFKGTYRHVEQRASAIFHVILIPLAVAAGLSGAAQAQSPTTPYSIKMFPGTLDEVTTGSREAVILRKQCLIHSVIKACSDIIRRQNEPNFVIEEVVAAALYKRGGMLEWRNDLSGALRDYEAAAKRGQFPYIKREIAELKARIKDGKSQPKTAAKPDKPKVKVRTRKPPTARVEVRSGDRPKPTATSKATGQRDGDAVRVRVNKGPSNTAIAQKPPPRRITVPRDSSVFSGSTAQIAARLALINDTKRDLSGTTRRDLAPLKKNDLAKMDVRIRNEARVTPAPSPVTGRSSDGGAGDLSAAKPADERSKTTSPVNKPAAATVRPLEPQRGDAQTDRKAPKSKRLARVTLPTRNPIVGRAAPRAAEVPNAARVTRWATTTEKVIHKTITEKVIYNSQSLDAPANSERPPPGLRPPPELPVKVGELRKLVAARKATPPLTKPVDSADTPLKPPTVETKTREVKVAAAGAEPVAHPVLATPDTNKSNAAARAVSHGARAARPTSPPPAEDHADKTAITPAAGATGTSTVVDKVAASRPASPPHVANAAPQSAPTYDDAPQPTATPPRTTAATATDVDPPAAAHPDVALATERPSLSSKTAASPTGSPPPVAAETTVVEPAVRAPTTVTTVGTSDAAVAKAQDGDDKDGKIAQSIDTPLETSKTVVREAAVTEQPVARTDPPRQTNAATRTTASSARVGSNFLLFLLFWAGVTLIIAGVIIIAWMMSRKPKQRPMHYDMATAEPPDLEMTPWPDDDDDTDVDLAAVAELPEAQATAETIEKIEPAEMMELPDFEQRTDIRADFVKDAAVDLPVDLVEPATSEIIDDGAAAVPDTPPAAASEPNPRDVPETAPLLPAAAVLPELGSIAAPATPQHQAPTQHAEAPQEIETPHQVETPQPIETLHSIETAKPIETPQQIVAPQPIEVPRQVELPLAVATPPPEELAPPVTLNEDIDTHDPVDDLATSYTPPLVPAPTAEPVASVHAKASDPAAALPARMIVLDSRGACGDHLGARASADTGSEADQATPVIQTINPHHEASTGWFNPFGITIDQDDALAAETQINKLVDDQLFLLEAMIGRSHVQANRSTLRHLLRLTNVMPNATFRTLEQVLDSSNWQHYDIYVKKLGTRSSREFFALEPRERELEKLAELIRRALDGVLSDAQVERSLCGWPARANDPDADTVHVQLDHLGIKDADAAVLRRAALIKAMSVLDADAAGRTGAMERRMVLGILDDFVDDSDDIDRIKSWARAHDVTLEFAPFNLVLAPDADGGEGEGRRRRLAAIEAAE